MRAGWCAPAQTSAGARTRGVCVSLALTALVAHGGRGQWRRLLGAVQAWARGEACSREARWAGFMSDGDVIVGYWCDV
jgi:hypothetical protein